MASPGAISAEYHSDFVVFVTPFTVGSSATTTIASGRPGSDPAWEALSRGCASLTAPLTRCYRGVPHADEHQRDLIRVTVLTSGKLTNIASLWPVSNDYRTIPSTTRSCVDATLRQATFPHWISDDAETASVEILIRQFR